jgi:hypothetical protein
MTQTNGAYVRKRLTKCIVLNFGRDVKSGHINIEGVNVRGELATVPKRPDENVVNGKRLPHELVGEAFAIGSGGQALPALDQRDADGALAAGIPRVGLGIEGNLLALLHHLEATVGDGRMMEEEVAGPVLRRNKAEATVTKAPDSSGGHAAFAFWPASLAGWPVHFAENPGGSPT